MAAVPGGNRALAPADELWSQHTSACNGLLPMSATRVGCVLARSSNCADVWARSNDQSVLHQRTWLNSTCGTNSSTEVGQPVCVSKAICAPAH
jgi:hypothetical protein